MVGQLAVHVHFNVKHAPALAPGRLAVEQHRTDRQDRRPGLAPRVSRSSIKSIGQSPDSVFAASHLCDIRYLRFVHNP